jgi:hypothetical protein
MKIFSKNTWGVDVNNAWPLTCKASYLKKIELRPLISGFDLALLEVRNLCVASRLPLEEQFCIFKIFEMSAIFKMAAKTWHKKWAVKIQHCPISSKFDMWVDNDVPN